MSQQLNSKYYEKGDIVQVQTLGVASNDAVSNSWILNAATKYNVESITKVNASKLSYKNLRNKKAFGFRPKAFQ